MHLGSGTYVTRTPIRLATLNIEKLTIQRHPLNALVPNRFEWHDAMYRPDADAINHGRQHPGADSQCYTPIQMTVRKSKGVSLSPPEGQLYPRTVRTGSHPLGGAQQGEAGGVMMNSRKVLSDGVVRDEVTQLRSLRKLQFCL